MARSNRKAPADKMVPHNVEAEEAVLGSLLIDIEAATRVTPTLKAGDFYIQKNAWIYEAICALYERHEPVDFVTLCDELERQEQLEEIGGAAYITHLINAVPSAIHAESYARIVRDASRRRQALAVASHLAQAVYDESQPLEAAVAGVQAHLVRLAPMTTETRLVAAIPDLPSNARPHLDGGGAGEWLQQYVTYAQCIAPMTPAAFHEGAGLWLASLVIARRIVLRMAFDDIYPNVWQAWIAPTTLWTKSTALNVARRMADEVARHLMAPQELTPEALICDMAGMEPGNLGQMPLTEQQVWQDRRNYAAQRGWTLDEFSGLLASAGRDYNAGLLESLMLFYDCTDRYTRLTLNRGMQAVHGSYLTLIAASTPAAMAQHLTSERLWGMGWWPRFALLTPETARPEWREPRSVEPSTVLVGRLRALAGRLPQARWPDPPTAISAELGTGVFDVWNRYNRALRYDLLNDGVDGMLWGAYGRLPVQSLKVALILAAMDWVESAEDAALIIEMPHLARSIEITEWWRESTHRALQQANEQAVDRVKMRVIYQISKAEPNGCTFRDLCKAMKSTKQAEIETALEELVSVGDVTKIENIVGPTGGRPTTRYYIAKG